MRAIAGLLKPGDVEKLLGLVGFNWSEPGGESDLSRYGLREPDLTIAPDGEPYIYRWHLTRDQDAGSVYVHLQVASDPERPLHDHPWDNFSVILAGGYDEIWSPCPWIHHPDEPGGAITRRFRKGDTCYRSATEAHRLLLPREIPYTITLFTAGPKKRPWGFWYPDGWKSYDSVTQLSADGKTSIHIGAQHDKTAAPA